MASRTRRHVSSPEDELDLTELLDQVTCSGVRWGVGGRVVHEEVAVDEHDLEELHHLQGDVQADGNKVAVRDDEGEPAATCEARRRRRRRL